MRRGKRRGPGGRPPLRHAARRLPLNGGALRLAVVSDTHSHPHPEAVRLVEALSPDAILHGGDIGELGVLSPFEAIAETIVVRGNIDERADHLPDVVKIAVGETDAPAITILLTHVAVAGAKIRADAARLARDAGAQLIVCGHSHVPFVGQDRGLTVFNAGSIGPRRFRLPIVFGVIEIANGRLSMRHVDCETGEPWAP